MHTEEELREANFSCQAKYTAIPENTQAFCLKQGRSVFDSRLPGSGIFFLKQSGPKKGRTNPIPGNKKKEEKPGGI